jgi:hypothetical protein
VKKKKKKKKKKTLHYSSQYKSEKNRTLSSRNLSLCFSASRREV